MTMPFDYLDHTADACLRGVGETVEEAFCEAARAMFHLMVDLEQIVSKQRVQVAGNAEDLDLLLVEWLAALLAQKDLKAVVLSQFYVDISEQSGGFHLEGEGWGETLDRVKHNVKVEVKGVTYSGLHVCREEGKWVAQCVVDI